MRLPWLAGCAIIAILPLPEFRRACSVPDNRHACSQALFFCEAGRKWRAQKRKVSTFRTLSPGKNYVTAPIFMKGELHDVQPA
jgi:hypothetical protein